MRDLPAGPHDSEPGANDVFVVFVGAVTPEEVRASGDAASADEPDPNEYVPGPYGRSHWVDDEGIVHAEDASGAWTYDPRTGACDIVAMYSTAAYGAYARAHDIRRRLDRGEPLTSAQERSVKETMVQEALRDRFPPGSTLHEG